MSLNVVLPTSDRVSVDRLAQIFRDRTQSYKFLFFRSILSNLGRSMSPRIGFDGLLADMLVAAWWPAMVARLSIGNAAGNDTLTALLRDLGDTLHERLSSEEAFALSSSVVIQERRRGCLRYVPEALLSPWRPDGESPPLYIVHASGIELHARWFDYLADNLPIVSGWSDNAWLAWMQARNPNVVVNINKLGPPSDRVDLRRERKYFLSVKDIACIYTGEAVENNNLCLDHFLPRSFVGHDRIWNLAPVNRALNSSKGSRLPHIAYLSKLVELHHFMLSRSLAASGHEALLEQYCSDLRLSSHELRDKDALHAAYLGIVPPMMAIAQRMGFPSSWQARARVAAGPLTRG